MAKKKSLSPSETKQIVASELRRLGSKGGKSRAKSLTAEERTAIARKAALARWKKTDER